MPTSLKDTVPRKTVLLCFWKAENRYQAFSSIKHFTDNVTGYSPETLRNYLSRKNKPFEDLTLILTRVSFFPH
ncbi:MAG: hypothetical protein ABIQ88_02330 [Chitinophagaceae bacterium]